MGIRKVGDHSLSFKGITIMDYLGQSDRLGENNLFSYIHDIGRFDTLCPRFFRGESDESKQGREKNTLISVLTCTSKNR